jgi:N-acetylglucosaminyldiphosphoundecaprenol N-acetyl-beta-D-mannosaminyltransferase
VQNQDRVQIGTVPIDVVTMSDAVERVSQQLNADSERPYVISGVNASFVTTAKGNPILACYLFKTDLNVADGMSLVLAARILRSRLPERVTGIDLMIEMCGLASVTGRSVYLLGGMKGAAEGAAVWLKRRFPGIRIVGVDRPPMGSEFEPGEVEQIRNRITAAQPDLLFVCLGAPRQERWIKEFALDLPVKVVMGNGAAFDVLAGFFHRPPHWIQKIGMEWFYRMCVEPRRLWKRYILGNLQFVLTVVAQAAELRLHAPTPQATTR